MSISVDRIGEKVIYEIIMENFSEENNVGFDIEFFDDCVWVIVRKGDKVIRKISIPENPEDIKFEWWDMDLVVKLVCRL